MNRLIPLRPVETPAQRLLAMEFEESALSERMQGDMIRRTQLREAMLRLRLALSAEDGEEYERLRSIKGGPC